VPLTSALQSIAVEIDQVHLIEPLEQPWQREIRRIAGTEHGQLSGASRRLHQLHQTLPVRRVALPVVGEAAVHGPCEDPRPISGARAGLLRV
jgi:hypothetical protein